MTAAPHPPKLPPLHDLSAFEAAARLMSFLKASEEPHLTQSAVIHRIKSLEEFLGVPLFIRINRSIALTSFGECYLAAVRDILAQLGAATARLKRSTRSRLRIAAAPALGAKWLVTRAAGLDCGEPAAGPLFEDAMLMYEAAIAGHGVALTLKTLFDADAAGGQLARPFAPAVWDNAYNIILSPHALHKPEVSTFTDWLRQEALPRS